MDSVRAAMEAMVPELEQLEEQGVYSRRELREIVKKRSHYETLLNRRAPLKADYLRYVHYEQQLADLRRLRKQSLGLQLPKDEAEVLHQRQVHGIYRRATRRFKGDLRLWTAWLDFCTQAHSWKQLSKVATRALQLHPAQPALWAAAARHELVHHANAATARTLLQQGLRVCRGDLGLWVDYFSLELSYAARLRARRRALGLEPSGGPGAAGGAVSDDAAAPPIPAAGTEAGQPGAEMLEAAEDAEGGPPNIGSELPADTAQQNGAAEHSAAQQGTAQQGTAQQDAAQRAVLRGAVALVVFRAALKALPRGEDVHAAFLAALAPYGAFDGREALEEAIYSSLAELFPASARAWDLRARRHTTPTPPNPAAKHIPAAAAASAAAAAAPSGAAALRAAVAVYEEGLAAAPSQELFDRYSGFLEECVGSAAGAAAGEEGRAGKEARKQSRKLMKRLVEVCERAAEAGLASESLLLKWSLQLAILGKEEAALAAAARACQLAPQSPHVLIGRLQLLGKHAELLQAREGEAAAQAAAEEAAQQAHAAALAAVRAVPCSAAAAPLWAEAFRLCSRLGLDPAPLATALAQALLTCPKGALGEPALHAVAATTDVKGLEAGRELLWRLIRGPSPGAAFFEGVLDIELGREGEGRLSEAELRRIFEAAVWAHGRDDAALWARYLRAFPQALGELHWRARKALREPHVLDELLLATEPGDAEA